MAAAVCLPRSERGRDRPSYHRRSEDVHDLPVGDLGPVPEMTPSIHEGDRWPRHRWPERGI
jgi:hypothetical protein